MPLLEASYECSVRVRGPVSKCAFIIRFRRGSQCAASAAISRWADTLMSFNNISKLILSIYVHA